jgi:hypothetical protein
VQPKYSPVFLHDHDPESEKSTATFRHRMAANSVDHGDAVPAARERPCLNPTRSRFPPSSKVGIGQNDEGGTIAPVEIIARAS